MSNVLEYKRQPRKTMQQEFGAHVVDMRNKTTLEWRKLQDAQRRHRAFLNLVAAYREVHLVADPVEIDFIKETAEREAKRFCCQSE